MLKERLKRLVRAPSLPSDDEGATRQSSARAQHAESERGDFCTIVTKVTIVGQLGVQAIKPRWGYE